MACSLLPEESRHGEEPHCVLAGLEESSGDASETQSLNLPEPERPMPSHNLSLPSYQSPLRHHQRKPSVHRQVKETLNAHSEYKDNLRDGKSQHHINQYIIGEEIGRGSFGAVHLAVDQYGQEYAVKEFSKSRLRKRARSMFLRQPISARVPGSIGPGGCFNRRFQSGGLQNLEPEGSLHLIKEELAIMKKLNHPNLVSLIEVLDDPEEDSLYMVLEMCQKGVIMKVGIGERADPYDAESCRYWFRDMILGIEYLHAQGVAHRDIKPDNLLLNSDDVLKVVDFGVSEMFEKESDMMTAKSAGSPAFLPPELCVAKHGDVSGKAADIWSMGVSLYCLRFGRIPFEYPGLMELYEAIKNDTINFDGVEDSQFVDLMHCIMEKDPKKRITMDELRVHPWVTKNGTDPLLSKSENIASLVEPPTQIEMNHAITSNIGNLVIVMKAVNKLKKLLWKKHPERIQQLFGDSDSSIQAPSHAHESGVASKHSPHERGSLRQGHFQAPLDTQRDVYKKSEIQPFEGDSSDKITPHVSKGREEEYTQSADRNSTNIARRQTTLGGKGQAHNPMNDDPPFLGIGTGAVEAENLSDNSLAESPTAAGFNIYDVAYRTEVERIRKAKGLEATIYRTRRVDEKTE